MVSRNEVTQRYYMSYFNLNSAFAEYCDYVTSSETIRTLCHIGDDFKIWRDDEAKTVSVEEITFSFPKEDHSTYEGIPSPVIGDKIKRLDQDVLTTVLKTYRVDRIENQNKWITTVTGVLDEVERRGHNVS